jgi:hypothetical protein
MLKDIELVRIFGIPNSTIQDWKKGDKNNWRYKLYTYLRLQDKEKIKITLEFLKSLDN